ncbi:hypothetical protein [Fusobacterium polymorphum]
MQIALVVFCIFVLISLSNLFFLILGWYLVRRNIKKLIDELWKR